jgi:hypothetical protein
MQKEKRKQSKDEEIDSSSRKRRKADLYVKGWGGLGWTVAQVKILLIFFD